MATKRFFSIGVFLIVIFGLEISKKAIAQPLREVVDARDLYVRDPYILADEKSQTYFLYKAGRVKNEEGEEVNGVVAYKSKDLKKWEGPYSVFAMPDKNWADGKVWAPEVHYYKGKYYLFATINSDMEWKGRRKDWPKYTFRGTQIFYSDDILGPFLPFDEKEPHTPMDRMALDGTLWEEEGIPYMIYCHEWVEIEDGTMELVQLAPDLSEPVGSSLTLFHASSAPWSTGAEHQDGARSYVTDGCFIYRTKEDKLLMIWSSFKNGSYAIGVAESTTQKIRGPWIQQEDLLFEQDGGHGMLFQTFDGRLMITFHGPNNPSGSERMQIFEVEDVGHTLRIKR